MADAATIEIAGNSYRLTRKLSAMEQFHVTRRLGPALVICGVTFKMMMDGVKVTGDHWVAVAGPVMEIVSRMSDEDVEYVIYACMKTVDRLSSGVWAPVMTPDAKQFMFADMDQAELLRITVEVLRVNLENFAKGMIVDGSLLG